MTGGTTSGERLSQRRYRTAATVNGARASRLDRASVGRGPPVPSLHSTPLPGPVIVSGAGEQPRATSGWLAKTMPDLIRG